VLSKQIHKTTFNIDNIDNIQPLDALANRLKLLCR